MKALKGSHEVWEVVYHMHAKSIVEGEDNILYNSKGVARNTEKWQESIILPQSSS